MRVKLNGYSGLDHYKYYRKNVLPELHVNLAEFRLITSLFSKKITEAILKGKTVKLPHLGEFYIRKSARNIEYNKLPINWKATKKLWEERPELFKVKFIRYTDPYVYKLLWDKRLCKIKNKTIYKFKAVRGTNRLIANNIFNTDIDYFTKIK